MNSAARSLPDDIAIAIFLKLPVKTLIRFRCLSKPMSAAIRSTRFVERHHSLQRQNSNPRILVRVLPNDRHGDEPHFTAISGELLRTENIRIPFSDHSPYYPDLSDAACNGLVCLIDNERIAIWNPATRELKYIPPSPFPRQPKAEIGVVNLGFDSRSGEHKLIVSLSDYADVGYRWARTDQVELYSLSSNSWRQIRHPNLFLSTSPSFYDQRNDRVLWLGGRENYGPPTVIVSFNMRNESFSPIWLPESKGRELVLVEHPVADIALIAYTIFVERFFDLWVKKDVWTLEWRIGPLNGIQKSLGLWKPGQVLLETDHSELLLLNVESGEMENLGVFEVPNNMQIVVFVESLFPILGCTGHRETVFHEMIPL